MKKILIAGTDSYIGNSIKKWFSQWSDDYSIDEVDMRNDDWKNMSFSDYDVILHVAAIVHIKEKKELWPLYRKVNAELPCLVAKKAKEEGVGHFVFFSTKGVYRPNTPFIDKNTVPKPTKFYGKSKLEGENQLFPLNGDGFHLSILRPAVVYGEGCKGNFPRLQSLSERINFFPKKENKRSMIYIWNLCEYVRLLINDPLDEVILYPQNREYIGTLDIMRSLWKENNKKYHLSRFIAWGVNIMLKLPGLDTVKTMFTDTVYDAGISDDFDNRYCVYSFEESIKNIVNSNIDK